MIRFLLVFLVLQAVLFGIELLEPVREAFIIPFTTLLAKTSAWIVQWFDEDVISYGIILENVKNKFAVSIEAGCNGIEAVIILISAILAYPAPWKYKLTGVLIGTLAIQLLNLVRIISLFYLGQWSKEAFEWAHLYIWQALIMLDAIVVFLIWLYRIPKIEVKVSSEDMKWMYEVITTDNPLNYKFSFNLWTLESIQTLLEKEKEIELSKIAVYRLLKYLGLSLQRPLYKSYKQDPKKLKNNLAKIYPEMIAEARKYKARIYFIDETACSRDACGEATLGDRGKTAITKEHSVNFGFNLLSASPASSRGNMHFDIVEDTMNSEKLIAFLKKLRKDINYPIFIVIDNAHYYHNKKIQEFLKTHYGEIMIAFLSGYSSEPSPDEQV